MKLSNKNIETFSDQVFATIENNYLLFKIASFLFMLTITSLIRIDLWTFTMNHDTFYYVIKAFEITQGNWEPISFQAIGWPAFIAVFFKTFNINTLISHPPFFKTHFQKD